LQLDLGFMIDANKFTIYMNEIVNAVNYGWMVNGYGEWLKERLGAR